MKTWIVAFALTGFLSLVVGPSVGTEFGRAHRRSKSDLARGVDQIFAEWAAPGSPGCAVVLTDGGKVVLTRCYGLADVEHGVPIKPETRFELASVSKPFTAFAILLLEQSGTLSLADDIHEYLPELPDWGSPVTIGNLVYHTSGISDYVDVLGYTGQYGRSGFGTDDLLGLVARQRTLEFPPGTKWVYSNTNYALLAEIVARVTGRPFGEWIQENVFEPLGMDDTSFPASGREVLPHRASAYARGSGGVLKRSLVEDFEIPGPAHALSTVDDMARWIENLRAGKVGGFKLIEKMREKPTLADGEESFYAAGLGIGSYRGVRTAGHSGQTGAFKTELVYCPEIEVGVVVLANAGWMDAHETSRRVLDLYLEGELTPLPETAADAAAEPEASPSFALDPVEYGRFLGGYRLEADPSVLVAVAREGEWLVGAIVGEGLDFFKPVGPSEFENRNKNCRLAFVAGEGQTSGIERVKITLRGREMWAKHVKIPPDARWVGECVGFYYSDEIETAYEIAREPAGLVVRVRGADTRSLQPADTDVLAGGIGILTFLRDGDGRIIGFDFGEPEDFGNRRIRFARCERSF